MASSFLIIVSPLAAAGIGWTHAAMAWICGTVVLQDGLNMFVLGDKPRCMHVRVKPEQSG
jgi:hypothetical protein